MTWKIKQNHYYILAAAAAAASELFAQLIFAKILNAFNVLDDGYARPRTHNTIFKAAFIAFIPS